MNEYEKLVLGAPGSQFLIVNNSDINSMTNVLISLKEATEGAGKEKTVFHISLWLKEAVGTGTEFRSKSIFFPSSLQVATLETPQMELISYKKF